MKLFSKDLSFANIVQVILSLMMIALIIFTIIVLIVCLERNRIEDVIILTGMTIIMVPITILFIKTKF